MAGEADDPHAVAHAETQASDEGLAHDATVQSGETVASGDAPLAAAEPARDLPEVSDSRYTIGSEVGRGGLGRVLQARDEVLDRPVALKQLFASDDNSRRRFIREALITARLQHPAIIPVYDAGRRADRSPFYAMKLVAGRPLDQAIHAARTLAARLALVPTVLAVADAVAYAHSQRVIHRDLKPGNVLVGEFGETIVIDWGLAKDLSIDDRDALDAGPYRATASSHTVAGAVLGTPGYMAPEQAAGQDVDERADVYALGAILYHVVSGAIPHEGASLDEVIGSAIAAHAKPLREREPDTPADLVAIVDKAMAKDPAARYPSARELADDLRRFQTGQLVGAHRYTLAQRIGRWIRRNRAISVVVAIATVVLVSFGTWSVRRIMAERDRAVDNANNVILTQARVLRDQDPAAALAWLGRLSVDGGGWSSARTLAADALSRPLPDVLLHGTRYAFASPDGRYALGIGVGGVWTAELTAAAKPAGIRVTFTRYDDPQIVLCDDNRRGLVLSDPREVNPQLVVVDLVAQRGETRKVDERTWYAELTKCRASYRLSVFAERGRAPGLRWIDAATGEDRLIGGNTLGWLGAWLADDLQHVIAIDDQGKFFRFDVKTGDSMTLEPAFEIGNAETKPRVAMSRDGAVVIAELRGAVSYCDIAAKQCMVVRGTLEPGPRSMVVAPDGSWARGRMTDRGWGYRRELAIPFGADVPRGELYATADGKWLLGLHEGVLRAQDITSGVTRTVHGHDGIVHVQSLPDGRVLTVGREGTARVSTLGRPATPHGLLNNVITQVSPSARWLVADGLTNELVRRDIATGRTEHIPGYDTAERPLPAVNDLGQVARVARDGTVRRFAGGAWHVLGVHDGARVLDLRVLATGNVLSLGQTSIAIWEPKGPRYIQIPGGVHDFGGTMFQIDRRERRAQVVCGEHRCVIDLASGRIDVLAESRGRGVMAQDGSVLLTGSATGVYLVWDLDTRSVRKRIPAVDELYGVLGLSHDGRRAVVRTEIGVELVDLTTDARTPLRSKVPLSIGWALFSADGSSVIDNTTALWDVASGEGREIAPDGNGTLIDMHGDKIFVATLGSFDLIPDDLPRDPAALAALLRALPYRLDEEDTLRVLPDYAKSRR